MLSGIVMALLVLATVLRVSNSSEIQSYIPLSELCSLKLEIAQICKDISFDEKIPNIVYHQNRFFSRNYGLYCTTDIMKEEETILIFNNEGEFYYCTLNLVKFSDNSPRNVTSYKLEYFNCDRFFKLEDLKLPQDSSFEDSYHELYRRLQSPCNISLNLYSNPLPSRTYIMRVMNSCSLDNSWLCKDSTKANIIDSNYNNLFTQVVTNSYLSAEYDVGLNKDSYSIEVLALHQGGVRRECWANNQFQGVPITSSFTNIIFDPLGFWSISRYGIKNPTCRVIGYYKAIYTAMTTIQFYVNGTASAWVFNDSLQPNFPSIQNLQLYETKMNLIKDQFYYIRFDITYNDWNSGMYYFRVSYPGIAQSLVGLNDLYYPVRTDYSPLNLNTLTCNSLYFLPVPETNGDIMCPSDNPSCDKLSYNKNIADGALNSLCEYYRWENGIQKSIDPLRKIILIISNPCISSYSWTCESTGESNMLQSSIYKDLNRIFTSIHYTYLTLNPNARYSFQLNILTVNMLQLTCWSQLDFSGTILLSQGRAFSNSFTYLAAYRSCRWEGFIQGIVGDVEFILSSNSQAKLWIKYDTATAISCNSCSRFTYKIRMAKELYYYIRIDVSHSTNLLNAILNYKLLPSGSETAIPSAVMFQPIRLSMGVITGTPDITYDIPSNIPDSNIYFCPLICTSCIFSYAKTKCTSCIEYAILENDTCKCQERMLYYSRIDECEPFPLLSTKCAFNYDTMMCDSCVANASIKDYNCECEPEFYEDKLSNSCMSNSCRMSFNLNVTDQYLYSDTLLEVNNPCTSVYGALCEDTLSTKRLGSRKLIKFTNSSSSLSAWYDIAGDSSYTLSILNLRSGSFLLETFPTPDWTGNPVSSLTGLNFSLNNTQAKSYRLQGYLYFTVSKTYNIYVVSNASCRIYFDFLNEPWVIPGSASNRAFYLSANKYYYLRVDFLGIASNPLNFRIFENINSIAYILKDDTIYYADNTSISRWDISSCDSTIHTTSIKNGLRYCPILCNSCNIRINRSTTQTNEICDSCIENAVVDSNGKCECNSGYYLETGSELCSKCPSLCKGCNLINQVIICNSCAENAYLESGSCLCNTGYYLDISSGMTCSKCPSLCKGCNLINQEVLCNDCIDNSELNVGKCACNTGYYLDITSGMICSKCPILCKECNLIEEVITCNSCVENAYIESGRCSCTTGYLNSAEFCYIPLQLCAEYKNVSGYNICTSCVENAHLEIGEVCRCNSGFYQSDDNRCSKCPGDCRECSEINSDVICTSCNDMYYLSTIYIGTCLKCSQYCSRCIEFQGSVTCLECFETFENRNGVCDCYSDGSYMSEGKCVIRLLEITHKAEPNKLYLYFSQRLLDDLQLSDLDFSFPDGIDTNLLTIILEPIEAYYSYTILFNYQTSIDVDIIIKITFSIGVKDTLYNPLSTNPIFVRLSLYNYQEVIPHTCGSLCLECYIDMCKQCSDYAYLDDIYCACYSGNESESTCKPSCPENMKIDLNLKTCLPCDESCNSNNSTSAQSPTESESEENTISEYTAKEISEANTYSEISSTSSYTTSTTSLALGAFSSGLNDAWSLMNTIQIFTYLPLVNIEIPLILRKALISQNNSYHITSLVDKIISKGPAPYKLAQESGFDTASFFYNSAKPILICSIATIIHLISFCLNKFAKGRIKDLSGKILSLLQYGIYLRLLIQSYMDLAVNAFLQIVTVIHI